MTKVVLIEAILRMMGVSMPHETQCTHTLRAQQVASVVLRQLAEKKSDLSPTLVAAVIGKESSWQWRREGDGTYRKGKAVITGTHGEKGWAQIKPDGLARLYCADILEKALSRPDENIACAIRMLEAARAECGGEPQNWLGRYNGRSCGPNVYSDRVLAIEARAVPPLLTGTAAGASAAP